MLASERSRFVTFPPLISSRRYFTSVPLMEPVTLSVVSHVVSSVGSVPAVSTCTSVAANVPSILQKNMMTGNNIFKKSDV